MPDFDTRKPPEPNEPNRVRIQVVANKIGTLLVAIGSRILLAANRAEDLFIAHKRRILVIGGVLLFLVVGVAIGLRIYSTTWLGVELGAETVTCNTYYLGKVGERWAPDEGDDVTVCKVDRRVEVDDETSYK